MGGATSYQNFIALNKWGHQLEPDLILSYSGFNDVHVPWYIGSDGFRGFEVLAGFNRAARYSSSPDWVKAVGRFLPGLMKETAVPLAIRSFQINAEIQAALDDYNSRFPAVERTGESVVRELVIPLYVHALKSIKRDFQGVPVALAFQPYGLTPASKTFQNYLTDKNPGVVEYNKRFRIDVALGIDWFLEAYTGVFAAARNRLEGYLNDDWLFVDSHSFFRTNLLGNVDAGDGVHFSGPIQEQIARHLADELFPFLCSRLASN